jgi:hypothetical protein
VKTYRIEAENPYKGTHEEYRRLDPAEAKSRWEDLTGEGHNESLEIVELLATDEIDPPTWTDPDTGLEVSIRIEEVAP